MGKMYVIRKEGTANRFGLGEVVSYNETKVPVSETQTEIVKTPSVVFFKDDGRNKHFGLTKEQLDTEVSKLADGSVILNG